jgi:hypothetical protein
LIEKVALIGHVAATAPPRIQEPEIISLIDDDEDCTILPTPKVIAVTDVVDLLEEYGGSNCSAVHPAKRRDSSSSSSSSSSSLLDDHLDPPPKKKCVEVLDLT